MDISQSILITGASGYVGSHFHSELLSQGASQVYCLTSSNKSSEVSPFWIECDLRERSKVFEIVRRIQPSYIFHFAALGAKTTQSNFSFDQFLQVNTFGTQNLIDACIASGVCKGFINVSTAYEYGSHEKSISEKSDFSPYGGYAISKCVGSLYLDEKINSLGFPGITYRLFSVYGPGDSGRVIPLIIDALKTGKHLELFDIYRKRDFVHRDTVTSALLKFDKIRKNNINSINIGSGESLNIHDLVARISKILKLPIGDNIIFDRSFLSDTHWECDNTLLKQFLQPILLEDGLSEILKC